jgi:hypothetical protein
MTLDELLDSQPDPIRSAIEDICEQARRSRPN